MTVLAQECVFMTTSAPTRHRPRLHYGWIILATGLLTVFGALGLARFGYTLILPPMQEGLGLSNTEAGALATGNFIGYLCLALIGGALASRFSPRRVITFAALFMGVTMLLTATAGNFFQALVWRTLTGMGSGASNVPVMALLAAWFARERRGLATGVAVAGTSVALIVTGPLIPRLLSLSQSQGWRISWVVLGILGIGVGIACHFLLCDRPSHMNLSPVGEKPLAEKASAEKASAGARNGRAGDSAEANSWGRVYRRGVVWHLALIYTLFGFSYIIFLTFFARYLQGEQGYSKEAVGGLWRNIGWLSLFCGVIWGWVSDVFGRKYGLACVCFLQATAYALFAVWKTPMGVMVSVLLFGITAWSIPAIMAAACGDHLGPRLAPAALGFLTLFFGIGQATGPLAAGALADMTGSFTLALLIAAVTAAAGGLASLALHRSH
jgi:sugar phosphate permease